MSSPPPSDSGSDIFKADDDEFPEPTPETNIRDCGYPKWGLVIYRTTYSPDSTSKWDQFKALVLSNLRKRIADSPAPEILQNMDFIFVDDPSLDNISIADLQRRFRTWVESEGMLPFTPSQSDPQETVYVPRGARYEFFIMVDELALASPCVKLVRGFPEPENPGESGASTPRSGTLLSEPSCLCLATWSPRAISHDGRDAQVIHSFQRTAMRPMKPQARQTFLTLTLERDAMYTVALVV
ncbi:unnamed protein product [Colletotrichum noveboracense]|uniref:Uncharacterized protein n=1 Tax=Colletotrichum noveboracense TaxID=2664923 RepID=A0A9W4RTF3_9PEZI|nr:unnamed protein product [Colletotrichum noveboracense]